MRIGSALPRFVLDLIAAPPPHGEGVHNYLYRLARVLHPYREEAQIVEMLRALTADCGRNVTGNEIIDAVRNSKDYAWMPGAPKAPPEQQWPRVNEEQREAIISDNGALVDLWERSRPRLDDNEAHTEQIIDLLFPDAPLLCCGKSQSTFDTKPRETWRGELSRLQFIVPSPMSAVIGKTKDGRESAHAVSNTGPRRFLVCDFDTGNIDDQAALLIHLGGFAPLGCVVHSGGKSLHGWFYVSGHPEEKVLSFFRYAVSLGADRAMWLRSQFARMPDGIRATGERQTVFFLNLQPITTEK
jgi:hypothetical protein